MIRATIALGLLILFAPSRAAESSFFDSDGVKIRYQVEGAGPPVLLIHGYSASGDANWRVTGMNRLLSPDYQLITIDNRGHGLSDKPESPEDYGQKMAEDIVRLLDHLGIKKAHLVGYSMGAMIAMNVVANHPDRVESVTIGGMGWLRKGPIPRQSANATSARQACRMAFPDLGITEEQLRGIKVPMTVIIGEDDPILGRLVEPLEKVRPDVDVVVIPQATHISCPMKRDFKQAVKTFLDEQTAQK